MLVVVAGSDSVVAIRRLGGKLRPSCPVSGEIFWGSHCEEPQREDGETALVLHGDFSSPLAGGPVTKDGTRIVANDCEAIR
ncbi:hypothetical protein [Candidatus Methylacidithermus pantelleriae]|uniref:hypothetical protein n=1 Tax=Candidatus Methylacidithermus pantelleriae TaxID=2744239 RepID=UPI001BD2339A|nr:hypothetical protein [Candidatus Methylacidithermus pantelleriae]